MEASLHKYQWWLAFASIIRDALNFFDFSSRKLMFGWLGLAQLGRGMHDPHFPATSASRWFHRMFCLKSHSGSVHTLSWKVLPCSIWKNAIFWGREFGMETLVEVIEDKSVVVISQFQSVNLKECIVQK